METIDESILNERIFITEAPIVETGAFSIGSFGMMKKSLSGPEFSFSAGTGFVWLPFLAVKLLVLYIQIF